MDTYWRHIWTGTCHRAQVGHEWRVSIFEPITKTEYDDWVLLQQAKWTWTPDQLKELKQLDELGKVQDEPPSNPEPIPVRSHQATTRYVQPALEGF